MFLIWTDPEEECLDDAKFYHGEEIIFEKQEFAYKLTEPVTKIFNTSLSTGEVPILWKCSNIIPIPKVKQPLCESNTQPISFTPILSKVLEDFVVSWMIEDVGEHIDSRQLGSLKRSSTTYCLLDLIHNWLSKLDNPGCYLRAWFLDFNKAFDRINHTIVIRKLIDLGVCHCIIPWICSFLTDRWQCVKLGQTVSNWLPVRVPQGTKLGHILFVIMINDLKLASTLCSFWKYVDDITISEFAAAHRVSILQSELNNISTWAATNNMVLNPKKCKEMTLRFRRVVDHLPSALAIDTKALGTVDAHKVLGVTIQSNLKWDLHINEVVAKASKRLHILRVLKRGRVPPADLLKVYFVLIRSVLEYCCPVWHNALPIKLPDSIERVQKWALRIIFPALHYQEALATTGCVSLHTKRMELCSKLFTKIKEPESRLRHLVPPTRSQAHGRSLCNKDRPSLISCKTECFKQSFFLAMCLYAHGM